MSFELFLFDLETHLYSLWKTKEVRISRQTGVFFFFVKILSLKLVNEVASSSLE